MQQISYDTVQSKLIFHIPHLVERLESGLPRTNTLQYKLTRKSHDQSDFTDLSQNLFFVLPNARHCPGVST
eukprot:6491499-Amphidinium_carterae.3